MLPRSHTQSLRCPRCRAENYPFASFCIQCGEPFDTPDEMAPGQYPKQRTTGSEAKRQGIEQSATTTPGLGIHAFARREAVLGIFLLLAVLAIAGWEWQRQTSQSEAYRQGLAAQRNKNWDAAADAFASAGDHLGAANQAINARSTIAERNRFYLEGVIAGERKDWQVAAKALRRVQEIEPGYAATTKRLEEAQAGVSSLELGGTVYLSTADVEPGLFFIDGEGHTLHLSGSDAGSRVRASSELGTRIVYDVPAGMAPKDSGLKGVHSDVCTTAEDSPSAGRVPVLAVIGSGPIEIYPMPDVPTDGTGVFTPDALWWYGRAHLSSNPTGMTVTYIKVGPKGNTATKVVGWSEKRRLLAFDPARSRAIVGQEDISPITGKPVTYVYTADSLHDIMWMTRTVEGKIKSAAVSRDGRWLLVVAEQQEKAACRTEVWAISLETVMNGDGVKVAGPRTKLSSLEWNTPGVGANLHLSASFIPSDGGPVRAIVNRIEGETESLTVYNLDGKEISEMWSGPSAGTGEADVAGFNNSGELLASPRRYGSGALLELLTLARPDFVRWFNVPLPSDGGRTVRVSFAPHNNYIIAASERTEYGPDGGQQQVLSAARVSPEGDLGQMRRIGVAAGGHAGLPVVAAAGKGSLLTYVSPSMELRAVDYGGVSTTVIARHVAAVWSLGTQPDLAWARQK